MAAADIQHVLNSLLKPLKNENIKVLILSLLGATIFWFFNSLNKQYSTKVDYPIEFLYQQEGVITVEELPSRITMDVTGGGWNLLRLSLNFRTEPIQIPLNNPTEVKKISGSNLLETVSDQLTELKVNFIYTDTLHLDIEPMRSRRIDIEIDSAAIDLEDDHIITSGIIVFPDTVRITGPMSIVDSFPDPYLVRLTREEVDDDFNEAIDIPNPYKKLEIDPDMITVEFSVARLLQGEVQIPYEMINFPDDQPVMLSDSLVTIQYRYLEDYEDELSLSEFVLVCNYAKRDEGDSTVVPDLIEKPKEIYSASLADTSGLKLVYGQPN